MIVSDFTALPDGSWLSVGGKLTALGAPVVLTFSFPTVPTPAGLAKYPAAAGTFAGFNEHEKQLARGALDQWASVSGITFLEVAPSDGDLQFEWMDFNLAGVSSQFTGLGFYPFSDFYESNGTILISTISPTQRDGGGDTYYSIAVRGTRTDTQATNLLLHEIGHALGLKHPFEAGQNNSNTLATSFDDKTNTVMSYTGSGKGVLGDFDIAAVRYLYGDQSKDYQQFSSWSYDPSTYTVRASGSDQGEFLYGNNGTNDIIRAGGGNDYIATRSGDDRIYAGDGDDKISGGVGTDLIFGGAGIDTAGFSGSRGSYTIEHRSFAEWVVKGPDGTDTVVNVEHLFFSDQTVSLDTSSDYQKAATLVFKKMISSPPDSATVANISTFEASQYEYGRDIGVSDPALYVFQAMGLALSEHQNAFAGKFGPTAIAGERDYILAAYQSAFGRAPIQAQIDHYQQQVDYFQKIYADSGAYGSEARIDLLARGAVYGQMLGVADALGLLV